MGANSTILSDITIGNNALVGAGSVVTKSVPRNKLVFGNPAKIYGNINNTNKIIYKYKKKFSKIKK